MAFNLENGYQPRTFEQLLQEYTDGVNQQYGTSYDTTTIVGTEFYRVGYTAIQLVMQAEAKTAEISAELTDYIRTVNENIKLPRSTIDGFIGGLLAPESEGGLGLISTIKDIVDEEEAGNMFLVVDADDGENATGNATITNYANLISGTDDSITIGATVFTAQSGAAVEGDPTFQASTSNEVTATSLAAQINAHATAGALVRAKAIGAVVNLRAIHGGVAGNSIALAYTDNDSNIGATVSGANLTGGTDNSEYPTIKQEIIDRMHDWLTAGLFYNGTEEGTKTALNGQVFNYKYALPTPVEILVRITVTVSANAKTPILNENQIRDIFDANFAELYRLGLDFEPEKYLEIARDLTFASDILIEYSEDLGSNWDDQPRSMAYNEKILITEPATVSVI